MNQDEIFKLLLLILLMNNEHNGSEQTLNTDSKVSVNDLIIGTLLLSSCKEEQTRECGCTRRTENSTF